MDVGKDFVWRGAGVKHDKTLRMLDRPGKIAVSDPFVKLKFFHFKPAFHMVFVVDDVPFLGAFQADFRFKIQQKSQVRPQAVYRFVIQAQQYVGIQP